MQFLILAHDATDSDTPARRMAAREAHLALIAEYKAAGNMIVGAALLNDAGQMAGSVIMADFPSRAELDAWLKREPYILQKVWGEVQVLPCKLAPSFAHLSGAKAA